MRKEVAMDTLPKRVPGDALKEESQVQVEGVSVDEHFEEIRAILGEWPNG